MGQPHVSNQLRSEFFRASIYFLGGISAHPSDDANGIFAAENMIAPGGDRSPVKYFLVDSCLCR